MKNTLCALVFVFAGIYLQTVNAIPDGPLPDAVLDRNIKTVQFYREGWEFAYPILEMNASKPLILSFDDISPSPKLYNYTVLLCDADWMPSRLSFSEYAEGFNQNTLSDYQPSFSTHIPYTHYSLSIPNSNLQLKLSGNYVLLVYETDEDKPIFIKRFTLLDKAVDIIPNVHRATLPVFQNTSQEVDFRILNPNYAIDDPFQTIKVVIVKNNQWKLSISGLKPLFIRDKELEYNFEETNLFLGGNEYRSFDTKSLKYQEENVQSIGFNGQYWVVKLRPDKPRDRKGYMYQQELNGKYLIQNQQGNNPNIDAEYLHVQFSFPMDAPLIDGDIYVWGGFTDFNCYDDTKMTYNLEAKKYELDMMVKQGYYNYQYVYVAKNSTDIDERYFEGSYYETENNYVIYVYHRPFGCRYDKLIGVKIANSLKNTISF